MDNTIDLFEHPELLPQVIQVLITGFDFDEDAYAECKKLEKLLLSHGYTFEWGLDGEPFNLNRVSECEIGDWAMLTGEAVGDSGYSSNYGMVQGFSGETLTNNTEPTYLAHVTLKNGESATVGAHEIIKLY